jgi:hypothetical protein
MKSILKDRSFRLSIILTLIFLGTGFIFLHFGMTGYGWVFFVLLPVVLGISIGALPSKPMAYLGLVIAIIVLLVGLVTMGLEGIVCVIMILPIVLPLIFIVSIIIHLLKRYDEIKKFDNVPVLILPLLIFIMGVPIEKQLTQEKKTVIEVKSEIFFNYSNTKVYDAIKSVDTLVAKKPFLMKLDLPVPQKCVLEKEEVGSLRTCYFSGGRIIERITALEKGKLLKMEVIKYELTGRKWLGFKEAIYLFDSLGINRCKMTRITTYTSELKPRLYWQPLEQMGIEQEHEYVFANLTNDLKRKYNN